MTNRGQTAICVATAIMYPMATFAIASMYDSSRDCIKVFLPRNVR